MKKHKPFKPKGKANNIDVFVGKRVHLRRLKLGFTQQYLSDLLGVTFQQLQKYESGQNRISASRMYDICKHLDVNPNYVFGWDE